MANLLKHLVRLNNLQVGVIEESPATETMPAAFKALPIELGRCAFKTRDWNQAVEYVINSRKGLVRIEAFQPAETPRTGQQRSTQQLPLF
jgi:hypothetical protein